MRHAYWPAALIGLVVSLVLPQSHQAFAAIHANSAGGSTLTLSPAAGPAGISVGASGSVPKTMRAVYGYIMWDGTTLLNGFSFNRGSGAFSTTFIVPLSATTGTHNVTLVVGGVSQASAAFSVTSANPGTGTNPTATPTAVPTTATPTNTPVPATATPPPTATALPTATSTPSPTVSSTSGVYVGVWQPGGMTGLSQFEQGTQTHAAIVMDWRCWNGTKGSPDLALYQSINQHGSIPLITWNSTNWDNGQIYSLADIANGVYDSTIANWAQQLASLKFQVMLRFDHEMNGTWYTGWSGNPTAYTAAWRHVHDVFVANGASNVLWVWSPNVWWPGSHATDATPYYPGDAYVDWMGLDGYNYAPNGWMWFGSIFNYAYNALTGLSQKPLLVGETATAEATPAETALGQTKSAWVTNAFGSAIPSFPRIKAVVWFNEDKTASEGCCNWPVESSSPSQSTYAQAIKSSTYRGYWP